MLKVNFGNGIQFLRPRGVTPQVYYITGVFKFLETQLVFFTFLRFSRM